MTAWIMRDGEILRARLAGNSGYRWRRGDTPGNVGVGKQSRWLRRGAFTSILEAD
jgi:hypothetical protein